MSTDVTAPKSSEKSIQEHLRNYYSRLQQNTAFNLSSLFDSYRQLQPSLHKNLNSPEIDYSALKYAITRLPSSIYTVKTIIFAQNKDQLLSANIDVTTWEIQGAASRRRLNFFDHITQTLVVLINSDSDVDDFINCLLAFQLERQKISNFSPTLIEQIRVNPKFKDLISPGFDNNFIHFLRYQEITIQSLKLEDEIPKKVVADWWNKLSTGSLIFNFDSTPLYFISSNSHSLANIIGGFVNHRQDFIIAHIEKNYPDLYQQWVDLKNGKNGLRVIDFLYYVSSKYFADLQDEMLAKTKYEESLGIKKLKLNSQLSCDVQLIPISAIAKSDFKDPNLTINNLDKIKSSQAYILNIEYPLGLSAYYLLSHILAALSQLKGVYIIGKAAILTGAVGDIQIPGIVFDERLNNIFHINNIFNQYFPFPTFQSNVLQNQKAISVYGTFLENTAQLKNYTDTGFNLIEMESGSYLAAINQKLNNENLIPQNVVAHIDSLPFDFGIINYASDNPLSRTLGDAPMALTGVEPTYLAALTVIQRIIDKEESVIPAK